MGVINSQIFTSFWFLKFHTKIYIYKDLGFRMWRAKKVLNKYRWNFSNIIDVNRNTSNLLQ